MTEDHPFAPIPRPAGSDQQATSPDEARKALREELSQARINQDLANRLLASTTDMLAYVDSNYVFRMVNERYARNMGRTRNDITGRGLQEIVGQEAFAGHLKPGLDECFKGREVNYEIWMDMPGSGRSRMSMSFLPQISAAGNINGAIIVGRDITVRTRVFEALRQSEIRYRTLARNLPGGFVAMFDRDLRIILADGAGLTGFGFNRDDAEGRTIRDAMSRDLADRLEPACRRAMRARSESIEVELRGRVFEITILPVHDREEIAVGMIVCRDISAYKQLEEELRGALVAADASSKAKSAFVANMSHEIRTPVSGMLGIMDILASMPLPAEALNYLGMIRQSAATLLTIINDILDISRIEAGKMVFSEMDFDLREILKRTIAPFQLQAEARGLTLTSDIDPDTPALLRADPDRLAQIVRNLLGNALKFTSAGYVRLSVRQTANNGNISTLLFTVEDSGIGIPEDKQDMIFEYFTQADSSTTRNYGGTGLGLAICRQMVRMLGGEIHLESAENIGSTFCFSAKLTLGQNQNTTPNQPQPLDSTPSFKGRKILLAEDNKINRVYLLHFLELAGFQVTTAEDGLQALDAFDKDTFDVILLDVQMPNMSGDQAATEIRRRESEQKRKRTPIIALTAYAMTGDRERFLACGMDEYLAKPIDIPDLWGTISKSLGGPEHHPQPQTTPTTDPSAPPIDREALKHRFGQDRKVLAEALDLFLSAVPAKTQDLQAGLDNHDATTCSKALHSLVNNMIAVTAKNAATQCRNLENLARKNDLAAISPLLPPTLTLIDQVVSEVRNLRQTV